MPFRISKNGIPDCRLTVIDANKMLHKCTVRFNVRTSVQCTVTFVFTSIHQSNFKFMRDDFVHSMRREFVAGGTAGAIGIFIGFPFDSIKVKLQSHPGLYRSALDCLRQSLQTDGGYLGLYRGSLPPVLMQGILRE